MVNMAKLHPLSYLIICMVNQNGESKKSFFTSLNETISSLFFWIFDLNGGYRSLTRLFLRVSSPQNLQDSPPQQSRIAVFLCVLSICSQISDTVSLSGYKTTFSNHKKPRPISNAELWNAFSGTIREKDFYRTNNKMQNSL